MSRLLLFLLLFAPSAQAAIGIGSVFVCDGTNSYWSTTLENLLQPASIYLSNLTGLASGVFTNVPLGGTNLSVRTVGGTNFIDTTGQLNNWAGFPTNVWNSREGGHAALTNLTGLADTTFTNVPLGGTNISIRASGGTNFIDTTGQLNNWSGFPTNTWNSRQGGTAAVTNLGGLADTTFTNVPLGGTNISLRTAGGTNFIDTTGHLNNWGQIPTGAMANATSTSTLTNWINSFTVACSNLSYAIGSSCSNLAYAIGTASTNYANSVTNSTIVRQGELTTESNLLWSISVTTKTATTVTGAGSGSTNYLISISTNGINYFYFGSSNVNIYTVSGSTLGSPILWTAVVSNLSANTWGFTVASGTNRWRFFSPVYGTNRPITLTNNTALCLNGQSDGTNTLVNYYYFTPGL